MRTCKARPYWEMTTEQLREATKEFDADFVPTKPLTPEMRRRLGRARTKGRFARDQADVNRVVISVERNLLTKADAFAQRHGLTRSELIARALRSVMRSAS